MGIVIEKMDNFSANKKYPPTPAQWQAIGMTGTDILVAAAAGSGKTEVLSERISRKIALDKWDINRVLVLTFTTAAAKNMLVRIENKIEERLLASNKKEDLEHLKRQRLLMGEAKVSTIDSFCLNVLQKFYYLVEENINGNTVYLSPNFKILANNTQLLRRTIDTVLENYIESNSQEADILFDLYGKKQEIISFFTSLYYKVLSIPNYKNYIKNELTFGSDIIVGKLDFTALAQTLKNLNNENIYNKLAEVAKCAEELLVQLEDEDSLDEKISNIIMSADFNKERENFLHIKIEELNIEFGLGASVSLTKQFLEQLVVNIKNYENSNSQQLILEIFEQCRELRSLALTYSRLKILNNSIVNLLLAIDNSFIEKKREQGYLDFADLNHLAINALEKIVDGKKYSTEASEYYKKLFLEIYVDEYQDNNDLQEYILNLIKGDATHFFRVGDVKQSIYGFRGSNPDLFEEKYQIYTKLSDLISMENYSVEEEYLLEEQKSGICVVLKENFRSKENILQSSNYIFNRLMYKGNAGISYDEDSALYYPTIKENELEKIPTYIMAPEKGIKIDSKYIFENIAQEILKGVEKGNNFSDYAILLRNTTHMQDYKEILEKHNIPVYFKEKKGLTESHSFNIMYNLLKFLNNNNLDASLLVVLRSGIFNFNNDNLVELSLEEGETLYDKLKNSMLEKSKYALNFLKKWQDFSYNNSALETLKRIAWDIDFVAYLHALDFGYEEVDYFENLLDIVAESSVNSINFSDTITTLQEIKTIGDYDTKRRVAQNSVTLSTIHISKGLEYNYVFVADLDKKLNTNDATATVIFSRELGLSVSMPKLNSSFVENGLSLFYQLNTELIKKKNIEEEIRNLYVALTRAVRGLYLATTEELDLGEELADDINDKEQVLGRLSEAKSFSNMLKITLDYYSENNLVSTTERGALFEKYKLEDIIIEEKELVAKEIAVVNNIDFEFPDFINNIALGENKFYPAKTSYSALKKINKDSEQNMNNEKKEYLKLDTFYKKNMTNDALLRGNLIHKLFEKIVADVTGANIHIEDLLAYLTTITKTDNKIKNIVEQRILTQEEFDFLNNPKDLEVIKNFINNELFEILFYAEKIEPEIPFTTLKIAKDIFKDSEDSEPVILQGVADLLVKMSRKHYIIIDYKTDNVGKRDGKKLLLERHSEQLNIYAEAVKSYYGQDIFVEKYIYSYVLGKLIAVE